MLISIHDVPREEKHLLFCTTLGNGPAARRRARRRHHLQAVERVISLTGKSFGELSQRVAAHRTQAVA